MEKGFTVVEAITAFFLISVGILGAFSLISQVAGNASSNLSRLTASYLAAEGIEIARNTRDSNLLKINRGEAVTWDEGFAGCASGCEIDYNDTAFSSPYADRFLKNNGSAYWYDSGTDTRFQRKVTITALNAYSLSIVVDVYWTDRGKNLSLQAVSELFNWNSP